MKLIAKLFWFLLLTFMLLCPAAFAEPKSFISEGKYQLGFLDSQKDAKSLALIDAKKHAVEEVVKYLAGLSEVKDAKLTGDQISALATLILSVEVLSEERKQTGEISSITIKVRATLDAANVKDNIAKMLEDDQSETILEMQKQLATLQKELDELKAKQQQSTPQRKEPALLRVPRALQSARPVQDPRCEMGRALPRKKDTGELLCVHRPGG